MCDRGLSKSILQDRLLAQLALGSEVCSGQENQQHDSADTAREPRSPTCTNASSASSGDAGSTDLCAPVRDEDGVVGFVGRHFIIIGEHSLSAPLLTQGQGNAAAAATTPGQAPVTHPISHLHQLCPRLCKNVSCEGSS